MEGCNLAIYEVIFKEGDYKMDERVEKIMKIIGDIDLPEEFYDEIPEEEIIYDWDGGVINETK